MTAAAWVVDDDLDSNDHDDGALTVIPNRDEIAFDSNLPIHSTDIDNNAATRQMIKGKQKPNPIIVSKVTGKVDQRLARARARRHAALAMRMDGMKLDDIRVALGFASIRGVTQAIDQVLEENRSPNEAEHWRGVMVARMERLTQRLTPAMKTPEYISGIDGGPGFMTGLDVINTYLKVQDRLAKLTGAYEAKTSQANADVHTEVEVAGSIVHDVDAFLTLIQSVAALPNQPKPRGLTINGSAAESLNHEQPEMPALSESR